MSKTFKASDGIPFRKTSQTGTTYIELTSPIEHGMKQGEYVIFSGTPFYINFIGNEKIFKKT